MSQSKERVVLTVVDESTSTAAPFEIRLRRLLKVLLRQYGVRCVAIHQTPESTSQPDSTSTSE